MHVNDMLPNPMKLHEENQQLRRIIDSLKEDLRDQFAMAALQGLIASENAASATSTRECQEKTAMEDANRCYMYADAMLAAREGREG